MITLPVFCLVCSFAAFAIAVFWAPPKGNLLALGLALFVLALLLGKAL